MAVPYAGQPGLAGGQKAILAGDAAEVQPHRSPVPNVSAYNRNFFVPFA
jgi:hypothetical protein